MSAEFTQSGPAEGRFKSERPPEGEGSLDGGIVERAIRQLSERRDVVVWEGEPVDPGRELRFAHDAASLRSEQLRSLRTELIMRMGKSKREAATVAVLGSGAGEGRSMLCAELALAFAQLAGKTLLVDADMRNPSLHRLFTGSTSNAGLSEVLIGNGQNMPLHRVTGPRNLAVLFAGAPPSNPVDLLSGVQFERLVRDWSRTYDYIVIDTPPTSLYSDGVVVANAARNVLLVARRNQTSYSRTTELKRRLDSAQTRIVGAVLNDF